MAFAPRDLDDHTELGPEEVDAGEGASRRVDEPPGCAVVGKPHDRTSCRKRRSSIVCPPLSSSSRSRRDAPHRPGPRSSIDAAGDDERSAGASPHRRIDRRFEADRRDTRPGQVDDRPRGRRTGEAVHDQSIDSRQARAGVNAKRGRPTAVPTGASRTPRRRATTDRNGGAGRRPRDSPLPSGRGTGVRRGSIGRRSTGHRPGRTPAVPPDGRPGGRAVCATAIWRARAQ